jgi:cell wall-associated NlpC family hydrolase
MKPLIALLPLLLVACASAPARESGSKPIGSKPAAPQPSSSSRSAPAVKDVGDRAASYAAKMLGKPYRFGGATPRAGFDCSGLVQYSFLQAGASVPHNTDRQRAASRPVHRSELRRGDLVFFDEEGKKSSHVGIYLGDGKFVHAPSSGKTVRSDRLDSPYWKKHLSETRRLPV